MPRPILGALQLEGEVFSLDIPSYRTRIPGRSRPRTITSQRTGQKRVDGAECRDQSSAHFSSREKYFLLTFPLIEPASRGEAGHALLRHNAPGKSAWMGLNAETNPRRTSARGRS